MPDGADVKGGWQKCRATRLSLNHKSSRTAAAPTITTSHLVALIRSVHRREQFCLARRLNGGGVRSPAENDRDVLYMQNMTCSAATGFLEVIIKAGLKVIFVR